MAFTSRTRLVNPRLGTYFGIFTAAFAALVLMALMFEQLGATDAMVRLTMFAGPLALYAVIGLRLRGARGGGLFRLRPQGARLLQRAGARRDGARRRRVPGTDRLAADRRVRRHVPQHRLVRRPGLHGGAVRSLRAQVRRLHGADVPRAPLREPHRARGGRRRPVGADPPPARGRGALCRLCRRLDARPIGAADGGRGGGLRRRHRAARRHALAHLVERRQGHRRAAGAGGVRQHRRPDDLQPAAAADDARQRACACSRGRRSPRACPSCWRRRWRSICPARAPSR